MSTALKTYHVKPHDDGWSVEATDAERPSAVEGTKAEAVDRAKEIAQNQQPSQVIVHKQDGSVQHEYTYGEVETNGDATARATPREKKVAASDAGYALAGLATDALQLANEAISLARQLPSKAQGRAQELRDLKSSREQLEDRLRQLRESIEERFDEKATQGRTVTEDILGDERLRKVLDQAKSARSQVKAAITSIRKTGDQAASSAARAGKQQAKQARSQVKAAATSVKKTADAAAGRDTD